MIVHVFNSNIVSGPETLVIPALPGLGERVAVVFLSEARGKGKAASAPAYARSFGLETFEIPVRSRWDTRAMLELRRLLARLQPRIVHSHEVKASTFVAMASLFNKHYKLYVTNHGVRGKTGAKIRLYEAFFIRVVMRRFDRVLTVNSSDRQLLIARGVRADKILVHLNGVDRAKTPPERREAESARIRREWGLDARGVGPRAICLGVVARLSEEKRHTYMLRMLKALKEAHPELDVHLVAFGTGALDAVLKSETSKLGLESCVHWMGYRKTVGVEMAGFDLLLSLSVAEGLPINVLEAGWAGTPVLATAVDGCFDVISSPELGTLVKAEELPQRVAKCLARLLTDPSTLRRQGVALQNQVEKIFSGKAWIHRLKKVYALFV